MSKPNAVRKTKLVDAERQQALAVLLMRSTNGRLKHRDIAAVAETEGIYPSTVSRIWTHAKTEEARTGHCASPSRRHMAGKHIVVQQDNSTAHILEADAAFAETAVVLEFNSAWKAPRRGLTV
ncbi:unnamed protein product [Phytophthora fragariaefolia]|uniref:Unnamed protein product n=1 Tax=Phytophthora fragariaefolia TaxID=1490495 RepID=A0A9W6YKM1_9STRA|nr:unnamed protein product [Phytophthora fragariaefolia]